MIIKKSDEIMGILEEAVIRNTATGMERVHIAPKELADCCLDAFSARLDQGEARKKGYQYKVLVAKYNYRRLREKRLDYNKRRKRRRQVGILYEHSARCRH